MSETTKLTAQKAIVKGGITLQQLPRLTYYIIKEWKLFTFVRYVVI